MGGYRSLAPPSYRRTARHPHSRIRRVQLLLRDNPHSPKQTLFAEPSAKVSAHAITRVGEHRTESNARLLESAYLLEGDAPLRLELDAVGNINPRPPLLVVGPRLWQVQGSATGSGMSSFARVADTRDWQFACFPSAPQY